MAGCQRCRSVRGKELPCGKASASGTRARDEGELFWDSSALSAPALCFITEKVCKLWGVDAQSRAQPGCKALCWGREDECVCAPWPCRVPSLHRSQAGLQGLRCSSPWCWPFRHVQSRDRCRQPPLLLARSDTPQLSHAAGLNPWVQRACLLSRSNV